ncbi:glycosyltransferase family 4 protein [bacterium]|nr:glycosyltransferase family 4 protein [bacterium]
MRIVVISRFYWPDLGGAQSQLRMLARQWGQDGHDVTVLTCRWNNDWPAEEEIDHHRVIRWPVWTTRFAGTVRFVWQIDDWLTKNRARYDVVMVSMLKHAAWMATRASGRLGFPVFLKSWGAGTSGDMAWQRVGRLGGVIRAGTKRVDGIFAPSRAVEAELKQAGYPRILLIPNGVPPFEPVWDPEQTSIWRQKLGWVDRPTIVTTGRLSWEKGVRDAVAAMPIILKKVPQAQLVMVGEGPLRGELEELARSLGVADRVMLPGAVRDVESSLRSGDLYLLPSHFEGLSVALLEALCFGMPAVVSDTPANLGILPTELLPTFPARAPAEQGQLVGELLRTGSLLPHRAKIRADACSRFGIDAVARQHIDAFEKGIAARSC